eukprot:m.266040 g.266040  ORF g.266040 m.266040 type:complete len:199 (+) comp29948_c0_seq1:197-793(+)
MFSVLLLALLGAAFAQQPNPCFSPSQWHGRQLKSHFSSDGHGQEVVAEYSYDAKNLRKARIETVTDIFHKNETKTNVRVIEFHKTGVEYTIDLKSGHCTKGTVSKSFWYHSVIANATFEGEFYLGSSSVEGASVLVQNWASETSKYDWSGFFTVKSCIPLRTDILWKDTSTTDRFHEEFYDVILGIDENVFNVPANCP